MAGTTNNRKLPRLTKKKPEVRVKTYFIIITLQILNNFSLYYWQAILDFPVWIFEMGNISDFLLKSQALDKILSINRYCVGLKVRVLLLLGLLVQL